MMGKINYKIILVIWIVLGISIAGYFKIEGEFIETEAIHYYNTHHGGDDRNNRFQDMRFKSEIYGRYSNYVVLCTVVGAVLIGGIGFFRVKK